MTGIIPPTSGRVRIAGFDLMAQPLEAKRRLAFVPDEPRLFDYLTSWDHLIITSRLYGVADGAARAKLLLDEFELGDRRDAYPSELSRGMKQKLMVAMALLHRPEAILLDEPLTGLDPVAMRHMKTRIQSSAASGVAVILSSHMLHLVEELCERVVVVVRGQKVLDGTLEEIRQASPGLSGDADLEAIFMKAVEGDAG
jgi:ABC-2 type transport system ATP-binding protein